MKKKVVVIGGGLGGLGVCVSLRKLDPDVDITLLEPKEYLEVPWCSYRGLFEEDVAYSSIMELKDWATKQNVKHIQTSVTQVSSTQISLATSFHIVDFDACVICVGALMQEAAFHRLDPSESYHSMDARHEQVKARGEQLLNCSSVAVVGGGLVGIELAGDLAYFAKERKNASLKNIILVHSGRQLADREFTPAAAKMATKKLQHLGVEIILNEKVVERQNNEWTLQSTGKLLQVDQVVMTTGLSSNTAFLEKRHKTHEGSWIQVDSYFQVQEGDGKLWAIGDCCTALPNTGMAALENAKILAHNLKHSLNNLIEDTELMKKAKKPAKVYIATIGRKTGVARGVLTHTQFFFPGRKNKTLFLSHVQSLLEIE